jgi:hypothetical protein
VIRRGVGAGNQGGIGSRTAGSWARRRPGRVGIARTPALQMCRDCERAGVANVPALQGCRHCTRAGIAHVRALRTCGHCECAGIANVPTLCACRHCKRAGIAMPMAVRHGLENLGPPGPGHAPAVPASVARAPEPSGLKYSSPRHGRGCARHERTGAHGTNESVRTGRTNARRRTMRAPARIRGCAGSSASPSPPPTPSSQRRALLRPPLRPAPPPRTSRRACARGRSRSTG